MFGTEFFTTKGLPRRFWEMRSLLSSILRRVLVASGGAAFERGRPAILLIMRSRGGNAWIKIRPEHAQTVADRK
jgi:hypothetical protein